MDVQCLKFLLATEMSSSYGLDQLLQNPNGFEIVSCNLTEKMDIKRDRK